MEKRRLIILALFVAIIIITSGLLFFFSRPPKESTAQAMALRADEIGPGWTDAEGYGPFLPYPEESSAVIWDYVLYNDSGNIDFRSSLTVFNSIDACNAAFENLNSSFYSGYENKDWCNYSIVPIGDKAIYLDFAVYYVGIGYSKNNSPEYMFMRGNVLCIFWCPPGDGPFSWQKDVLLNIVELQLEKTDQYLAQHPGVN